MAMKQKLKCWNCGSYDLEDMGTWQECRGCGATVSNTPKPSGATLKYSIDPTTGFLSASPSEILVARVAKERL